MTSRWSLIVLCFLLFALVAVFVVVLIQDAPTVFLQRFALKDKFRLLQFLGVSMGGVLLAIQAIVSHNRVTAMENAVRAQTQGNATAEKGLKQERLKNAIEHLGHNSESIRLGGAYELFHLAKEESELRQTIFDILCAHIRTTTGNSEYRELYSSEPSEEIQSILTLVFVKEYEVFEGLRADLRKSWLNGVDLWHGHLDRADLWQTHLKRAGLLRARLQGVILMEADVREAQFYGADLREALLTQSDFRASNFVHADLRGVHADSAKFDGAGLQCADLRGADLTKAHFLAADLTCATMQAALLNETSLVGADLFLSHLDGVTCTKSDGKDFGAIVRSRIGKDADLSKAMFHGGITIEDVKDSVETLSRESSERIRRKLDSHIGKASANIPPEEFDATVGSYGSPSAEEWIEEFKKDLTRRPDWRPLRKLEKNGPIATEGHNVSGSAK